MTADSVVLGFRSALESAASQLAHDAGLVHETRCELDGARVPLLEDNGRGFFVHGWSCASAHFAGIGLGLGDQDRWRHLRHVVDAKR